MLGGEMVEYTVQHKGYNIIHQWSDESFLIFSYCCSLQEL